MNNAVNILSEERERLVHIVMYMSNKLHEACTPALSQRPGKDMVGQDEMVSYIDLDKFTPEQREKYDRYVRLFYESLARLCVLENYIKSLVSQETIQSYNQVVRPVSEFKDTTISCNTVDLDKEMNFTKYGIKVGSDIVESPAQMTFDEYSKLYITSLSSMLVECFGKGLTEDQAMSKLKEVCEEVYLQTRGKGKFL